MTAPLWMTGTVAEHTRGRILKQAAGVSPVQECPTDFGICLMFGADFQEGTSEFQQDWLNWSQRPGRLLLLVPPFKIAACDAPVEWEIVHGQALKSPADSLANLLIKEVRYALRGKLQVPTRPAGDWGDHSIHTGYYCKHPNAGIFSVTCLPLWSLAMLDQKQPLKDWLSELYELAGQPAQEAAEEEEKFTPTHHHFAAMLYLLAEDYRDRNEALAALTRSSRFDIASEMFDRSLRELEEHGLVNGASVTERGRAALYQYGYAVYADELEAMKEMR